jgi:transcriptional regulator with XRE-family HTH domain
MFREALQNIAGVKNNLEVEVGRRIRELRKRKGKSIEWLAERADLHLNSLSLIERGKRNPSLGMLQKIAIGLNVEITTLFNVYEESDTRTLKSELVKRINNMNPEQLRKTLQIIDTLTS